MADIDFSTITDPISDDQPCGPDLDMEFDMDFMNFTAEIDGLIPTRYFSFDAESMPFAKFYEQIAEFLERTRDIRILVPLAKLRILDGDLQGFVDTLDAIDRLLKEHWADVHPQAVDFLEMSMGQLSTLDDMPNSVLPFQHANLFRTRRAGALTLRKWQVAKGEVSPREDEERIDASLIISEVMEAEEDDINGVVEKVNKGRDAIAGIRATCIEEAGFDDAPIFEKLPESFDAILALISEARGGGEVADASDAGDADGAPAMGGTATVHLPTGDIQTREDAIEAMFQTARYFTLYEPSSPAALLLREAESAASKSFSELLDDLLPESAQRATFMLGEDPAFRVLVGSVHKRNPVPDYERDGEAVESSSWEDIGLDDEATDNDQPEEASDDSGVANDQPDEAAAEPEAEADAKAQDDAAEASDADASDDDGAATEGEDAEASTDGDEDAADAEPEEKPEYVSNVDFDDWSSSAQPEPEPEPEPEPAAASDTGGEPVEVVPSRFEVTNRPAAMAMMEKIMAYYRAAEPSSPVLLILQRASDLTGKSFIELLGRVLPEDSLVTRSNPSSGGGGGEGTGGW